MAKFSRILAPVEFSPRGKDTAQYAEALAHHFGAEVILLHVGIPQTDREPSAAGAEKWPELELSAEDTLVRRMMREGDDPARVILKVAASERCDLIVMPTHGHRGIRRFLQGSITAQVIHDAGCPVWTG